MSDEPLFCTWCGAEDFNCDCDPGTFENQRPAGPYCEVCGVIPEPGTECWKNRNSMGCEPKKEE